MVKSAMPDKINTILKNDHFLMRLIYANINLRVYYIIASKISTKLSQMPTASNKKVLNWFWIVLLLAFAYLQFNDPDPLKWAFLYSVLALLIFLHAIDINMRLGFLAYVLLMIILFILCLPDLMNWIQAGMPSLTQEMKATEPTIESMRELGGILICLVVSLIYYRSSSN